MPPSAAYQPVALVVRRCCYADDRSVEGSALRSVVPGVPERGDRAVGRHDPVPGGRRSDDRQRGGVRGGAGPAAFENTAWYWLPLSAAVVAGVVYDEDVAPAMLVNVFPPFVDTCHWTVGVGSPVAAAVKVAAAPAEAVWFVGWVVTDGAVPTWKSTGSDVWAGVGPPLHTAVSVCVARRQRRCGEGGDAGTGIPDALGTPTVPRSVVPSKKSTCPTMGSQ